jgi:hypothetical protein
MSKMYKVIEWPACQQYMEEEWFEEEAILINTNKGVEKFGSSAFMIPCHRLETNKLYKFASGEYSVQALVWAKNEESALILANTELKNSNELFNRPAWEFSTNNLKEVLLTNKEETIMFFDAYTF